MNTALWQFRMNFFDVRGKLIVVSLCLYFVYFYSPYVYEKIYDPKVLNLFFLSPVEPVITISEAGGRFLLVAHLVGSALLFFRVLYAKYVYFSVVFLDVVLSSLSGITTYAGFDMSVLALLNMSDGIIFYLSFFGVRESMGSE